MTIGEDEPIDPSSRRIVQVERLLDERDQLIHDLEVHQAELQAQNQQLRDAQELLEASRARYSDLYDFAPVAYCTLDAVGCISEINLTGATLLATPRARVIGKPFAVYVAEPDRAAFRTHLQRCGAAPGGRAVVDLTLADVTRPPIVIQMVSVVVVDQAGVVQGCRSSFTDSTEQKRAEEALQLAVRMREDFLAIVSHDLRSPLSSILLGSEVLQVSAVLDASGQRSVGVIHHAALRMSRMLSDLLDLSSMDAGHLSMECRPERVEDLLAALVESATPGAAAKSIQLDLVLGAPGLIAYCDRDRVLQVLMNLVGNAIKFSAIRGRVAIEARAVFGHTELCVRDEGVGITASQLEHIFDPYWQVAKTAKLGTGLGLAIARGIVEVHGGRIWAESVVGRGSSFCFTLPTGAAVAPARAATPAAPRTGSGPLSGSHPVIQRPIELDSPARGPILIVDDELDVRTLLTELLHAEGWEVATAADGACALDYLHAATTLPCLIILDLVMPNMDGWQFIEARSHIPRLASIPVVLASGQFAIRDTARALGLASYLEKPILRASLLDLLARTRDLGAAAAAPSRSAPSGPTA
jgi:signal transduction histidine kinase/CheY-like chemotaxis protein